MRAIKLRRPSPALIVAGIALFIVLGGTGYAATQSAKKKPVTKAEVNKLISKYVKSHKKELTGPSGAAGATGGAGGVGPQGPGAVALSAGGDAVSTNPAGTAGPWTISLKCEGGAGVMIVNGPGEAGGTSSLAGGVAKADTYVNGMGPIGAGAKYAIGQGGQEDLDLILRSGSTTYSVHAVVTAVDGGLFTKCALAGVAIPAS